MIEKEGSFILDEITEIKKVGKRHTYDFNMPTGCFIAQKFLVHNSDTVMLLYWPDHNEINYADKTEFEVHVAKQRHGSTGLVRLNFHPWHYRFENREEQQNERTEQQTATLV